MPVKQQVFESFVFGVLATRNCKNAPLASPCLPIRLLLCYNLRTTKRIFIKFHIWAALLKCIHRFQRWPKVDNNNTLHEDLRVFVLIRVYLAKYLSRGNILVYRT
jgi:hypothetical protein